MCGCGAQVVLLSDQVVPSNLTQAVDDDLSIIPYKGLITLALGVIIAFRHILVHMEGVDDFEGQSP